MLSKSVDVIDTTKPVITGVNNIIIDSDKLELFILNEYYKISDNYDIKLDLSIKYFTYMFICKRIPNFFSYLFKFHQILFS